PDGPPATARTPLRAWGRAAGAPATPAATPAPVPTCSPGWSLQLGGHCLGRYVTQAAVMTPRAAGAAVGRTGPTTDVHLEHPGLGLPREEAEFLHPRAVHRDGGR